MNFSTLEFLFLCELCFGFQVFVSRMEKSNVHSRSDELKKVDDNLLQRESTGKNSNNCSRLERKGLFPESVIFQNLLIYPLVFS